MEPIYYVSKIAQFLTYASFLSGARICHFIYQQRSCAKFSPMPFLAGLMCTALWLRYGLLADEWEIVVVNCIGLFSQLFYVAFFLAYSRQKSRLIKQLACLVAFLLSAFWWMEHSEDPNLVGGSLASLASMVACASPLATIKDVLRTKCVASLPLSIILSSFMVSLSWFAYGYLKSDTFIMFSNSVALFIGGAQLSLFVVYPSKAPYEKLSPSNKKSYDLIRLLYSDEDDFETLLDVDEDLTSERIDTSQDYKKTLTKIMGQIYCKREQMSKNTSSIMLVYAT